MMKRYRLQRVGTQMAGGPDADPTSLNSLGCNNACCTAYYVAILSVNLSHVFPLGLGAQSVPPHPSAPEKDVGVVDMQGSETPLAGRACKWREAQILTPPR